MCSEITCPSNGMNLNKKDDSMQQTMTAIILTALCICCVSAIIREPFEVMKAQSGSKEGKHRHILSLRHLGML